MSTLETRLACAEELGRGLVESMFTLRCTCDTLGTEMKELRNMIARPGQPLFVPGSLVNDSGKNINVISPPGRALLVPGPNQCASSHLHAPQGESLMSVMHGYAPDPSVREDLAEIHMQIEELQQQVAQLQQCSKYWSSFKDQHSALEKNQLSHVDAGAKNHATAKLPETRGAGERDLQAHVINVGACAGMEPIADEEVTSHSPGPITFWQSPATQYQGTRQLVVDDARSEIARRNDVNRASACQVDACASAPSPGNGAHIADGKGNQQERVASLESRLTILESAVQRHRLSSAPENILLFDEATRMHAESSVVKEELVEEYQACWEKLDGDQTLAFQHGPQGARKESGKQNVNQSSTVCVTVSVNAAANFRKSRLSAQFSVDSAPLKYEWQLSVWDVSLFIGAPWFSISVSLVLCFCLLLYLILAAMFMLKIWTLCTTQDYSQTTVSEFNFWRATIAHDVSMRNPITGESLASGVCNKRLSIPFSNLHVLAMRELDAYLSEHGTHHMTSGQLMCSLAVLVWMLTLAGEVRSILHVTTVCLGLPCREKCRVEKIDMNVHLISISMAQRVMVAVSFLLRICLVAFLGVCGVLYLVFTASIEDMLLNAVALDLILNLDELVFTALVPQAAQTFFQALLPQEFNRPGKAWHSYGEFMALAFLIATTFALTVFAWLDPYVNILRESRDALCGKKSNSLNFAVAVDAIGIPWAAPTPTSNGIVSTYAEHAILQTKSLGFPHNEGTMHPEQRNNSGPFMLVASGAALKAFQSHSSLFGHLADWQAVNPFKFASVLGWNELEVLGPDGTDFGDRRGTVYNLFLQHLLGNPIGLKSGCAQAPFERCTKHGTQTDAVVMRLLCPTKCGCANPVGGVLGSRYSADANVNVDLTGCAVWNLRKKTFHDKLAALPCKDTTSRAAIVNWAAGVRSDEIHDRILASFDKGGCPAVANVVVGTGGANICSQTSLPSLCPESCGCDPILPYKAYHALRQSFCPHDCGAQQQPCFTTKGNHSKPSTSRGPKVGYACVFPFVYKGQSYTSCTTVDWPAAWCAVAKSKNGVTLFWGDCSRSCSVAR